MSEQLQLKDHLQPANSVYKLKIPMSIYLLFFMLLLSVSTLHKKKSAETFNETCSLLICYTDSNRIDSNRIDSNTDCKNIIVSNKMNIHA